MTVTTLRVLSRDELSEIHSASLRILDEVGMRFDHSEALDVLEGAGARIDRAENRAFLPPEMAEDVEPSSPGS